MAKLVSKTYGDALFELAISENKVDMLFEEAKELIAVFAENTELLKLLKHPKIVKEEKIQVIENIFKGKTSDDMTGFLVLVIKKDRHGDIIDILNYFIHKVKEYKKIGVAYVTTAQKLTDAQREAVCQRLIETTVYDTFEMNYQVDESLLGGMILRVGDKIVDSSIKTKINELAKNLHSIQLS